MSHSIYLKLATLFVVADLKREERIWKRKIRRSAHDLPWTNQHLLRDIGLDSDGRPVGFSQPDTVIAKRRVHHLRRILSARIPT